MAPPDAAADHTADTAARRLLARAARASRGRLALPVALGLAATLAAIAQAWLIARLLAALLGLGPAGWAELAGAAALALLSLGLGLAQERAQQAAGEAAKARLRADAFARLLAAGPLDPRPVGERTALVVDRIEALEGYFARWLPAALLALLAPALVAGAAALAEPASGLTLLGAGLLVPLVQAASGIGAAQAARRQFDALQRLSGRFLDRMRGLPTLVLFNRQEAEAASLGAAAHELRRRTMRVLRVAFLSSAGMELIAAGALALLALRHGAALAAAASAATAGPADADQAAATARALFVLLLVPAFFAPLRGFAAAYHERLAARGAAAALAPLLDEAGPAAGPQGLLLAEVPPKVTVTFQDVRLTYDPARPPALDGLSFRVLPGETLVLTGPSGAGKTSVLRLLMGFVRPDEGRIAINGRDITLLHPAELRRLSAYVGQRAHLFRATLRENIRLARPGATDAAVEAAARAAGVLQFAAALPQGLDTLVGEGGFGLSGGQAQRVAVARAFLRDAPLVLLDEPTAHLDPGTEAELWESLRRLCVGRTAIIASHARAARTGALPGARVLEIAGGRALGAARIAGT
ncbi:thiol reductant ABC exporter subunit CydD [Caldovatus aquaticus]|uniref:Thiol reductant ABC exporter subunit CydD n=1 Tax=Caldovatus aquaticus TaxID=2865671 RepID=A0ABS7F3I5_9PROT|nr:thiol reductant ABC exporter subunit CydD [Caldovatus aquaticus]MBW8269542.1 thiol reductant ABC exporter subunit CydD [Caldovatus aquaticus]